jgi:hypothetical protein
MRDALYNIQGFIDLSSGMRPDFASSTFCSVSPRDWSRSRVVLENLTEPKPIQKRSEPLG